MTDHVTPISARPQRWDEPFGRLNEDEVDRLLSLPPFSRMDPARFPSSLPLRGLLRNDARLLACGAGDLIIREGDYGHSVFLVLHGSVWVALESLPGEWFGRTPRRPVGWWRLLLDAFRSHAIPERREIWSARQSPQLGARDRDRYDDPGLFLQDVPGVVATLRTTRLGEGDLFGEISALARVPRSASVFADGEALLLEIRWQGLRDLMRYDPAFRDHVHDLYRERSLVLHLRQTPRLAALPEPVLLRLKEQARFESHGDFEWRHARVSQPSELQAQIAAEPLIAAEDTAANGVIMMRAGFARLSQRHGHGHRTVSYLGKGHLFGWDEAIAAAITGRDVPLPCSLRALGYVETIRIPQEFVANELLPHLSEQERTAAIATSRARQANQTVHEGGSPLQEFVVQERLGNGRQAMVIDLERCTRCDDCVKACAATHDGNPRFVRDGLKHGRFQFPHACMHCVDPVCMIGCPTGAIARDAVTGVVRIDDLTCIGCQTCARGCPYQNIRMVAIRDQRGDLILEEHGEPIQKATSCDLCSDRVGGPACQRACPHDALVRLDLTDWHGLDDWARRYESDRGA